MYFQIPPIYNHMKAHIQHKPKHPKPTQEELLQSDCDVCFVPFNKVTPKKIQEGLEILLCTTCHIHVHKACYNLEPSLTIISQKVAEFLCDRCANEKLQQSKCVVCYGSDGALKKIGENQVIHVYCGLMHNDIEVVTYYPSITFKKSMHYEETHYNCQICYNKNAHQNCAEESCRRKVHVYCAKKQYITLSKEVQEPKGWNHKMSVGNHGNFDLTDEIIPYQLLSQEVDISLKEIQSIGFDLGAKQELKHKVHKEYLEQLRSRRKSTKKLRRGGFSYVLCPTHQSVSYCTCFGKADGQDMVLCECCFEWYHHKCVKYTTTEDSYICQACKSFYDFKRKGVQEVRGGRSEYDVGRIELPLNLSVMDCMWVLRVLDNRIRGGLAAKMLKQLSKYPLKSSCMDLLIKHQNRNKLTALADDCLSQFSVSEQLLKVLRPRVVLAVDNEGKPLVVLGNVEFNRLIRKAIELLGGMGLRGQGLTAILRELEFKERALSDQYEQIIELSKVEQNYQEVQILKQKAQAYNFIEIINKIQQQTPVSINELTDSIAKANAIPNLPLYLTQTLTNKYHSVQPIIQQILTAIASSPQNTYSITQLVQSLQTLKVLPPLEYQQLMAQKKFIQNLYLYLMKQQGNKMEEEVSIAQQIDLLLASTVKPNQELLDIVNSYQTHHCIIWKQIDSIIAKYQNIAIQFQIKEILKRKHVKHDKFTSIINKAQTHQFTSTNLDIANIISTWKNINYSLNNLLNTPLDHLNNYEDINQQFTTTNKVIESIQTFPIKIEEDNSSKSLIAQAKNRKEQLEQLKILYTESQLQRNPLTLPKILPTLSKNNPLVKQWHLLKKQQTNFMNKFTTILARINERLQYFKNEKKLQRKQQLKENSQKPSINEITEFIQMLKHSSIDMGRQIKELTRIINNSLEIASRVKRYIEEKGDCSHCNLDQLAKRRKEIQEQRNRLLNHAQLSLKSELTELYHSQICNRMRTSLISPGLDLEKINTLLKFAEEENLTHTETYIALKEKFQTKNQKSKEVNLIKNIQQNLSIQASKDLSNNFTNLYVYRRGITLPEITDIKTKNSYIDDLVEKNKNLREKISNALQQRPSKLDLNEARTIYLQALKNPYTLPELNRMSVQVTKACQLLKRWKQIGRSFNHLHPIFLDYQLLTFNIEEIEAVKRQIKNNQDQISRLHSFVSNFDQRNRDQLQQILQRIQSTNVIRQTQICKQAQLKYLKYWIKLLQSCKINKKITPFQKIRRLTLDSYNLLQRTLKIGQDYEQLKSIIYQLQDYLILVKNHLKSYPTYTPKFTIADSFIDMEDFYLQYDGDDTDIADYIPILKPFSDLAKFRQKNLQRLEVKREETTMKRAHSKLDQLRGDSDKHIQVKQPEQSSDSLPQVVSENQRKKIKEIFLKNIRKNAQLKKYGECQNEVKMIENQIFGEWHNDIIKYFEMSESFQKLFIKLITCPNISNKIIKKKFEFKFIQILVSNLSKIDQLQGMIVNKLKQAQNEKAITKISQTINQKSLELSKQNQAVIQSIATGKVDQSLKQDLKKEMKLLKEGKHKKKKHHHKHRSRSKSPDAKFSSESQKELPSYIQNQYNKEQNKTTDKKPDLPISKPIETQSPLRYDPQEEQIQRRETIFPKGSILKLKNCDLQISTKKKGRVDFPVQILTEEEHKKILTELFDPGFSRLSIKKDKNQAQIIQYISKSKKKYKYLICWFQGVRGQDNQTLKEISSEANQKKKIFGWQNQHIKIHIMSIKQLVQINRFNIPARVSSLSAANHLNNQRLIIIIQYPQKIYQVRDIYKQFPDIQRKNQEFSVAVPSLPVQAPPIYDFYPKYTMPTIEPLNKPVYEEPKMIYEGGWGNDGISLPTPQPLPQIPPMPISTGTSINQIRMHFGFGNFSPILTDEDDNQQEKNNGDLASDLLNSLGDFAKMPNQQPLQREKPPQTPQQHQPQPQQQQQQYQGYYGGYGYQPQQAPQQARPIQAQNRWMASYPNMNQGIPPQPQVYNPLNPMASKFPPQMPQVPTQMYKNPLMGGQPQRPPPMGQYYRPPPNPNEGYDPRYQGGYQQ